MPKLHSAFEPDKLTDGRLPTVCLQLLTHIVPKSGRKLSSTEIGLLRAEGIQVGPRPEVRRVRADDAFRGRLYCMQDRVLCATPVELETML